MNKTCVKCNTPKARTEFYRHSRSSDGLNSYCKECANAAAYKSHTSPKGKAYMRQYDASEARRQQRQTLRAKELARLRAAKKRRNRPIRHKARAAISNAVLAGKMPRIHTQTCAGCGRKAEQYHHHKGYDKAFWLDVVPVCIPCHQTLESQS